MVNIINLIVIPVSAVVVAQGVMWVLVASRLRHLRLVLPL